MSNQEPSWKVYLSENPALQDASGQIFIVRRMIKGIRYPSWGFVTDAFVLSLRVPEGFEAGLITHSAAKTWVIFAVTVTKGKPTLGCRIYADLPGERALPWQIIKNFPKWVALDSATDDSAENSDDINSSALDPTLDDASINLFMKKQRSLGRQRRPGSDTKQGQRG